VIPSVAGLLEDAKGAEDVEMKEDGKGDKRVYTGTAALNFKRDHMRIQPLYEADGICKSFYPLLTFYPIICDF